MDVEPADRPIRLVVSERRPPPQPTDRLLPAPPRDPLLRVADLCGDRSVRRRLPALARGPHRGRAYRRSSTTSSRATSATRRRSSAYVVARRRPVSGVPRPARGTPSTSRSHLPSGRAAGRASSASFSRSRLSSWPRLSAADSPPAPRVRRPGGGRVEATSARRRSRSRSEESRRRRRSSRGSSSSSAAGLREASVT